MTDHLQANAVASAKPVSSKKTDQLYVDTARKAHSIWPYQAAERHENSATRATPAVTVRKITANVYMQSSFLTAI